MINQSKVKTPIDELQTGMYVCELDRPWLETPFLIQGFYIDTDNDIDILQQHCLYVYIDPKQSRNTKDQHFNKHSNQQHKSRVAKLFPDHKLNKYLDTSHWKDELVKAESIIENLADNISSMMLSIENHKTIDLEKIASSVDAMVESVIRNPDACIWLARLKNQDSYTFKHAMSSSIWAVALGRQIGLPPDDLKDLAVGAVLFDIGKLKLPPELLNKNARLSNDEFELIKTHVALGVDLLNGSPGINKQVLDIVAHHHERFNGSGYPAGLKMTEIPVFARIVSIVDCYDAITSERPYAPALSPSVAVKKLYEWRNIDFQAELVEEFIQAIGLYPAGTLVELSSGEVGAVLAEYRLRRLRPQILLLLNANKDPLPELRILNLLETTHDSDGKPLEIARSLEPGAYGIDPESLYQ
jgi:HD-GYP domain-containing protein (c-di-GMP phosphodiesterase class II)